MIMHVKISPPFREYAEDALVRLRYLHPQIQFRLEEDAIAIEGDKIDADMQGEVNFALYRQKILVETWIFGARLSRA